MKTLVICFALALGLQAKAANCPDPADLLAAVQTEGNTTITQDLADSCQESVQLALACQSKDQALYNKSLAIAAKVQCEYELIRQRNDSAPKTKGFKSALSRYHDLRYECGKLIKSEVGQELCKAESGRLVLKYFNNLK
jgi:hypothetical protein